MAEIVPKRVGKAAEVSLKKVGKAAEFNVNLILIKHKSMINRKIYGYIREFFTKESKALLISGARQVGKTYAIRHVGREIFERVVELNFIENPSLKALFANPRSAKEMLLRLSAYAGGNLEKGKTLFFFDEIQECPDIMTAIKFLVDEGSYKYVMSGSLHGVQMKDIRSLPVGYLTEKKMYPLDLEEFAAAVGMSDMVMSHLRDCYESKEAVDEVIHTKMLELVNLYLVIGGMPESVVKYLATNNLHDVRAAQEAIINMYKKDIAKYDIGNKLYIQEIFDLIPSELNAKNKRFILKSLNENAKYERYRNSFLWLSDAGVALPVYNVEEPKQPLRLNEQRNLFKLFMNDVGLLSSCYSFELTLKIITGEANINYGAIYENLAAQELAAHGYNLYYFNSKRQGEIDFVVEHNGEVLPIEIKSGKDFKRHNALSNVMSTPDYGIKSAMVFSNSNVSSIRRITYLPVYLLMFLRQTEHVDTIVRFKPV